MTARQTAYQAPKVAKILIAEDEELVGLSLRKDLEKRNYEVAWHRTFEDAARDMKEKDFHVILADIFLSPQKADGLELVKLAKDFGIPCIIMTSALDLEVAKSGVNLGADHIIEKPFEIDALTKVLTDIFENPRGLIGRRERHLEIHQLTDKEKEFCRLILKGLTNQEIADISESSLGTVKFYSSQIFDKFQVKNRAELFNTIFPT